MSLRSLSLSCVEAAPSTGHAGGRRASNASMSNSTVTASESLHRRQAGPRDADAPQACLRPMPPLRDSCIRVGQGQNPASGPSLPHQARRTPPLVQNSVPWPSESESREYGDCAGWRRRVMEVYTRWGRGAGKGSLASALKRTRAGPPGGGPALAALRIEMSVREDIRGYPPLRTSQLKGQN